jgi:hypothetical protein
MVARLILLLPILLPPGLAASCAAAPDGSFCAAAAPIRLSTKAVDAMSNAEVAAALANNRKGEKLCGWRP